MNILITGASKGLGFELVKQFAADKSNNIIAIARSKNLLEKLKQKCKQYYNNDIHICNVDFLDADFSAKIQELFKKHNHHFDVVINNAGVLHNKSFTSSTKDIIQKTFQVNYFATIEIIKAAIELTNKNKTTHIINIGSMGGYQGSAKFPGLSIYSSSKAALANLTECLAEEYKNTNIKFNCLALGSVQTEMLTQAFPKYQAQITAKEMAEYIHHFALNGHKYYNGKILPVTKSTP